MTFIQKNLTDDNTRSYSILNTFQRIVRDWPHPTEKHNDVIAQIKWYFAKITINILL